MSEAAKTPEPQDMDLRDRVQKVEWENGAIKQRLDDGAGSFAEVRGSLKEIKMDIAEVHEKFHAATKPKPIPMWKIAGMSITIITMLGGFIWMLAKYPDREEFNQSRRDQSQKVEDVEEEIEVVRERQNEIRSDQKLIKSSVERQEKVQEKIDSKLDRLIEQNPKGRRR